MKKIIVLLLPIILGGCVTASISVSGLSHKVIKGENIEIYSSSPSQKEIIQTNCAVSPPSRLEVESVLIHKDSSCVMKGVDRIDCKVSGYRWVGVIPEVIVYLIGAPIPVVVPLGSNHISYEFYENKLSFVHIYSHDVKFSTGFFYGATNEGGVNGYSGAWYGKIPENLQNWIGWDGYKMHVYGKQCN